MTGFESKTWWVIILTFLLSLIWYNTTGSSTSIQENLRMAQTNLMIKVLVCLILPAYHALQHSNMASPGANSSLAIFRWTFCCKLLCIDILMCLMYQILASAFICLPDRTIPWSAESVSLLHCSQTGIHVLVCCSYRIQWQSCHLWQGTQERETFHRSEIQFQIALGIIGIIKVSNLFLNKPKGFKVMKEDQLIGIMVVKQRGAERRRYDRHDGQ